MKIRTQISLLALALALVLAAGTAHASGTLFALPLNTPGSVALGVQDYGQLNMGSGLTVNGGASSFGGGTGPGSLGLAIYLPATTAFGGHVAGYYDSTSPGCLCEGWGVAANGVGAGADDDVGGIQNLTLISPASGSGPNVVSHVKMTSGQLDVVQDYHLSGASGSTFEDTVTLTNISGGILNNVMYRRVMDWDIPYTEFTEAVTIQGWPATNLVGTTDNGFNDPNPTVGASSIACPVNANFTDCDPSADHGALFDFNFGTLGIGQSKTFKVFYGAALTESAALGALAAVGAEVYSLGQSDSTGGSPTAGTPATYYFGFAGVGGTPLVPEPSSMLLFAVPALFAINSLKKKFRKA